jgi:glycosyl transferase family 25
MINFQVYLINLDEDVSRAEFMRNQLNICNIRYKRMSALKGTTLPEWLKPYFLDTSGNIASRLTQAEVGCYASHLAIMQEVSQSNLPTLVLEDDVRICPDFPNLLSEIAASPLEYEMIRLSCIKKKRKAFTVAEFSGGYKAVRFIRVPINTGAYIVSPTGASKFLKWKLRRTVPIDHDLQIVWENKLNMLGISPEPITANIFESTIDAIETRKVDWRRPPLTRALDSIRRLVYAYSNSLRSSSSVIAPPQKDRVSNQISN